MECKKFENLCIVLKMVKNLINLTKPTLNINIACIRLYCNQFTNLTEYTLIILHVTIKFYFYIYINFENLNFQSIN